MTKLFALSICVINVLPFLPLLFPMSSGTDALKPFFKAFKDQRRIILAVVLCVDAGLIATAAWLTRQHIYNIGYDTSGNPRVCGDQSKRVLWCPDPGKLFQNP